MKKQICNGLLISVEGVDGSGKSSLCNRLRQQLSALHSTLLTKEPGATELGSSLRNILLHCDYTKDNKAEFLLFAADRAQHFAEIVLPALQKNMIVISDRMADSSLVYQGYVKKLPLEILRTINSWAMHNRHPDITFFLDIDEEMVFERMKQRNTQVDIFEEKKEEISQRIAGFRALLSKQPHVVTLDAKKPLESLVEEAMSYINLCYDIHHE